MDERTRKESWIAPDSTGNIVLLGPAGLDALAKMPSRVIARLHPRLKEHLQMQAGSHFRGAPGMFPSGRDHPRDPARPSQHPGLPRNGRDPDPDHSFGHFKSADHPGPMGRYGRDPREAPDHLPSYMNRSKDEQVLMEKYMRRRGELERMRGGEPPMRGDPRLDMRGDPRDKRGYPPMGDPRVPHSDPREHRGDPREHHRGDLRGLPQGMDHRDRQDPRDRMDPRMDPRMDHRMDPRHRDRMERR